MTTTNIFENIMELVIPAVSNLATVTSISDFAIIPINFISIENGVKYWFDIPGFDTSEIKVQISKTNLVIKADNDSRLDIDTAERRKFSKKFMLHKNLNIDDVTLEHKNGVLYLSLNYLTVIDDQPRTLNITSS